MRHDGGQLIQNHPQDLLKIERLGERAAYGVQLLGELALPLLLLQLFGVCDHHRQMLGHGLQRGDHVLRQGTGL